MHVGNDHREAGISPGQVYINNNNNDGYLEHLTCSYPKHLYMLFFKCTHFQDSVHTHACTHAHKYWWDATALHILSSHQGIQVLSQKKNSGKSDHLHFKIIISITNQKEKQCLLPLLSEEKNQIFRLSSETPVDSHII